MSESQVKEDANSLQLNSLSAVRHYHPPKDGNYSIEYVVIEYYFASQESIKCILATTFDRELAEKLVMEDELRRRWFTTYRIYQDWTVK